MVELQHVFLEKTQFLLIHPLKEMPQDIQKNNAYHILRHFRLYSTLTT